MPPASRASAASVGSHRLRIVHPGESRRPRCYSRLLLPDTRRPHPADHSGSLNLAATSAVHRRVGSRFSAAPARGSIGPDSHAGKVEKRIQVGKAKASSAKEQFLELVDHRPTDHGWEDLSRPNDYEMNPQTREWFLPGGFKTIRKVVHPPSAVRMKWNREREECKAAGKTYWRDSIIGSRAKHCAYWWCRDPPPDDSPKWNDLLTAAQQLRQGGIDLHGAEVTKALSERERVGLWVRQAPAYEEFSEAIEETSSAVTYESYATPGSVSAARQSSVLRVLSGGAE